MPGNQIGLIAAVCRTVRPLIVKDKEFFPMRSHSRLRRGDLNAWSQVNEP